MIDAVQLGLCKELEDNIADEASARGKYYALLEKYRGYLKNYEIDLISEIISEELKHTNILKKMIEARSRITAEN